MKSLKHEFTSESDLCTAFTQWARPQGWVSYAETAGWDILLVNGSGVQIGVQAKLRFNSTLMRQVLPIDDRWRDGFVGPDYRGVLLPVFDHELCQVCKCVDILYFNPMGWSAYSPGLLEMTDEAATWNPDKRCPLPEYVPDVAAGASGPTVLTPWKIRALRVVAALEVRGSVTREDFKRYGVDWRRWSMSEWLTVEDGQYNRGPRLRFDKQHPEVFATILAEVRAELESIDSVPQAGGGA